MIRRFLYLSDAGVNRPRNDRLRKKVARGSLVPICGRYDSVTVSFNTVTLDNLRFTPKADSKKQQHCA